MELAAVTYEDAVPAAISQALRLAVNPGGPALETLLDALELQDVLIVVDNCEHLIGGCAKTAEAILRRCPRVHLLATSREPLGIGGETIYRVPSMSLPGPGEADSGTPESCDAVALFVERARAQGIVLAVDEQAGPLVVSICRRLDGMPLAIELAAARLRSMSLTELHGRLDQRFRAAHRGQPHRAGTPADAGRDGRLVLFAADRRRAAAAGRLSVFADSFGLDAACLADDAGDWDRAAALHGIAQAFQDRTGCPWEEFEARYRRGSLDQARAHLGDEQLERAYAQGMALSLEKAVDLALPKAIRPDRSRRLSPGRS